MLDIRAVIAARRAHRYANTRPWIIFNSVLSNGFDIVDLSIALSRRPFIQPRLGRDKRAYSNGSFIDTWQTFRFMTNLPPQTTFRATLLQLAAVKALRVLYSLCVNLYNLRYLDFIYVRVADCIEAPILDITWNNQDLLKEMCSPSSVHYSGVAQWFYAHDENCVVI